MNLAVSRMKYRIAVRGPRGERETIEWIERFTPTGGGTPVDTHFYEDITFREGVPKVDLTKCQFIDELRNSYFVKGSVLTIDNPSLV